MLVVADNTENYIKINSPESPVLCDKAIMMLICESTAWYEFNLTQDDKKKL